MRTNTKVYVLVASNGRLKIGSSANPTRRPKELGVDGEIVYETEIIEESEKVEKRAHRVLALYATHLRGEWFKATVDQAIAAIKESQRQIENNELMLGGELVRWRYESPQKSLAGWKPVQLRLSEESRSKLDDLRACELHPPSMPEMIRILIDRAHAECSESVEVLRMYGGKDCTAVADAALEQKRTTGKDTWED